MFKPYFRYVNAPGVGGKVLEHSTFYIKSEIQLTSEWAGVILNPYRDLQYGGVMFGFNGYNYWFSNKSLLGKILSFIILELI